MTWKLWRALRHPLRSHPLFRYASENAEQRALPPRATYSLSLAACIALVIWISATWSVQAMVFFATLLLPVLIFALMGTVQGAVWALAVCRTILAARAAGLYDLICLSPSGSLGSTLTLCTGCLHRRQALLRVNNQRSLLIVGAIVGIMLLAFGASLRQPVPVQPTLSRVVTVQFFYMGLALVYAGLFITALYLDYIQSVIVGSVIGMIAPTYPLHRADVQFLGVGAFLALQVLTYALTWLLGFAILPAAYQHAQFNGWSADLSLALLRLGIFYAVRACLITGMWRLLARRLNCDLAEIQQPAAGGRRVST